MSNTELVRKNFLEAKSVLDVVLANDALIKSIADAAEMMILSIKSRRENYLLRQRRKYV